MAIWFHKPDRHNPGFVFYAVNRLPVPVTVTISVAGQGKTLKSPVDGKAIALGSRGLQLTLAPYMLKSFISESQDFQLIACACSVPAEFVDKIKPEVAYARDAARLIWPPAERLPTSPRTTRRRPSASSMKPSRALPRASIGRPGESTGLR